MISPGLLSWKNEGMMPALLISNSSLNGPSNRVIAFCVIILFFGQIILLSWLGDKKLPIKRANISPELQLLSEVELVPDYGLGRAFSDPILFAKPNRRGFSGKAWGDFPEVDHPLIDWSEPGRPLLNEPKILGSSFRKALPEHLPFVVDIPVKRSAKSIDMEVSPLAVRKNSELEIIGGLSKRLLVRTVTLPSLSHGEAIRRTQVRIGVNPDGYVVSATIQNELTEDASLQAKVDRRALELLKGIRFQPNYDKSSNQQNNFGSLEWGDAIFHWKPDLQPDPPSSVNPVTPLPEVKQM